MTAPLPNIEIRADVSPEFAEILTTPAFDFVAALHRSFEPTRRALLQRRAERQARINAGERPGFLAETAATREAAWQIAPVPEDLRDRRVEITGPVERKMIINPSTPAPACLWPTSKTPTRRPGKTPSRAR